MASTRHIRVDRDVKGVSARVFPSSYLNTGDGAQKLENHIGVAQLQLIGVLRVTGHTPLREQKVKHDAQVVGRVANLRQGRQQHRKRTDRTSPENAKM